MYIYGCMYSNTYTHHLHINQMPQGCHSSVTFPGVWESWQEFARVRFSCWLRYFCSLQKIWIVHVLHIYFILDQKQNQSRPIGIWYLCPGPECAVQESVCHSVAAAHGSHRTWSSSWSTILRTACVLCCQFVCGTMLVCLLLLCSCCCYLSCNHGTFVIQPLFRHALSMPQAFPGGRGPALRNAKGPRQRIKWATLCSLHQAAKQF